MDSKWRKYVKLFWNVFYISAFTFGGGYVIVPLLKKRFVDELHWLEEKDVLDLVAIAQSSPGAIAVNGAVIIGYSICGFPGAVVAALGTVLPPLLILSVISVGYRMFIGNQMVAAALKGMQAGVGAVIVDVVWSMGKGVAKEKELFSFILMAAAFAASFVFKVNIMCIILVSAGLGIFRMWWNQRRENRK